MNEEEKLRVTPDELYNIIMDCKELVSNVPLIPKTEVIEASHALNYRAKFYYFSTSWFASIMPYSMDSAKIRKALNVYESYLASSSKKTVKDIMPIAILLVCAGVAVAIVLAVLQGFSS